MTFLRKYFHPILALCRHPIHSCVTYSVLANTFERSASAHWHAWPFIFHPRGIAFQSCVRSGLGREWFECSVAYITLERSGWNELQIEWNHFADHIPDFCGRIVPFLPAGLIPFLHTVRKNRSVRMYVTKCVSRFPVTLCDMPSKPFGSRRNAWIFRPMRGFVGAKTGAETPNGPCGHLAN